MSAIEQLVSELPSEMKGLLRHWVHQVCAQVPDTILQSGDPRSVAMIGRITESTIAGAEQLIERPLAADEMSAFRAFCCGAALLALRRQKQTTQVGHLEKKRKKKEV